MIKISVLFVLVVVCSWCINAQNTHTVPTEELRADFQKLTDANKTNNRYTDLSGKESINIQDKATVDQIIEITTPYLNSNTINAKHVCYAFLATALSKKAKCITERRAIIEIFCRYYLSQDWMESITNFFVRMGVQEKDFNENAKQSIRSHSKFSFESSSARLLSLAQIRESIPILWKMAGPVAIRYNLSTLASLARMDEEQAAVLLCHYYDSVSRGDTVKKYLDNSVDYLYNHVLLAEQLAFSLNKTVLNCLLADFNTIDINYSFHGGDYFFYPSSNLAEQIISILKNYPYEKGFKSNPKQLKDWLQQTNELILNDK